MVSPGDQLLMVIDPVVRLLFMDQEKKQEVYRMLNSLEARELRDFDGLRDEVVYQFGVSRGEANGVVLDWLADQLREVGDGK